MKIIFTIIRALWRKLKNIDIKIRFERELKTNVFLSDKGFVNHIIGTLLFFVPIPKISIGKRLAHRKRIFKLGLINTDLMPIEIAISNMSDTGACILTNFVLSLGEIIHVDLKEYRGKAVIVRYDSSRAAYGLAFLQ